MDKKSCTNCRLAKGIINTDGRTVLLCTSNSFVVNARMCCEEWTERYHNPKAKVTKFPRNKQSVIFD